MVTWEFWLACCLLLNRLANMSSDLLILQSQFVVELFEVLSELLLSVAATESDLKHLVAGRKCRQSGEALATTPSHSHQEGVALVHTNHPGK